MTSVFEGLDFTPATNVRSRRGQEEEETVSPAFEGSDFIPYEPPPPPGSQDKILRGAGRTVARPIETLAGLPGDLQIGFVRSPGTVPETPVRP